METEMFTSDPFTLLKNAQVSHFLRKSSFTVNQLFCWLQLPGRPLQSGKDNNIEYTIRQTWIWAHFGSWIFTTKTAAGSISAVLICSLATIQVSHFPRHKEIPTLLDKRLKKILVAQFDLYSTCNNNNNNNSLLRSNNETRFLAGTRPRITLGKVCKYCSKHYNMRQKRDFASSANINHTLNGPYSIFGGNDQIYSLHARSIHLLYTHLPEGHAWLLCWYLILVSCAHHT